MDEEIQKSTAKQYCMDRLKEGPVIAYAESAEDILGWGIRPRVLVSSNTSPAELRALHTKKDGAYQLYVITPEFGTRGVDFRSVVPPTLMLLGQFKNDRDAY